MGKTAGGSGDPALLASEAPGDPAMDTSGFAQYVERGGPFRPVRKKEARAEGPPPPFEVQRRMPSRWMRA